MREVSARERTLRKRLAARVIELREEKGWSQAELARRLGDSVRSRVTRLEEGKAIAATLLQVEELAQVFGCTPVQFALPILAPKDTDAAAAVAEQEGRERFEREVRGRWERQRAAYLAALDSEQAALVFDAVGRLGRLEADELPRMARQMEALVRSYEQERSRSHFAAEGLWAPPEEES